MKNISDERIRNALYQAGESLAAGLDIQKMLLVVLNLVKNLTDVAGCAIILFDEEKVIKASEGLDAEEDFFKHALFEQVAKEGKTGFIYDLKEEKAKITLKDERELRSILAIPVNFKGKTMGVLGICLTQPRYEEEEINLLTSFARQAGIAIENAQLYKEVKDKAEHIGILYRIARAVKASLDVEEVFNVMVGEMRSILSLTGRAYAC
jgi:GAF domain-containing protein